MKHVDEKPIHKGDVPERKRKTKKKTEQKQIRKWKSKRFKGSKVNKKKCGRKGINWNQRTKNKQTSIKRETLRN